MEKEKGKREFGTRPVLGFFLYFGYPHSLSICYKLLNRFSSAKLRIAELPKPKKEPYLEGVVSGSFFM